LIQPHFSGASTGCQLQVEIDGQILHVVIAEGRGPNPLPLLLTHGWPGSFLEYLGLLELLCDPERSRRRPGGRVHGDRPVAARLRFSGPPPRTGLTSRQVAALWHALMSTGLGHERYVGHGSDLGAGVTAWPAGEQPHVVRALHLVTSGLAVAARPRTEKEEAYAAAVSAWTAEEGGYAHPHATKASTTSSPPSTTPDPVAPGRVKPARGPELPPTSALTVLEHSGRFAQPVFDPPPNICFGENTCIAVRQSASPATRR
jgi:pimeloyl-ACP methyl ester carboxylesterase